MVVTEDCVYVDGSELADEDHRVVIENASQSSGDGEAEWKRVRGWH